MFRRKKVECRFVEDYRHTANRIKQVLRGAPADGQLNLRGSALKVTGAGQLTLRCQPSRASLSYR